MTTVGILTKNRTAAFRRCLESLRDNAKLFGRGVKFLVADDSDVKEARENFLALHEVGVKSRYFNRDMIGIFSAVLAKESGHASALRFALGKTDISIGAMRNFLMLMCPNEPLIMIDDDMVCKFADVPNRSDEVQRTASSNFIFQEEWRIDGVDESTLVDEDFIAKHEQLFPEVALTVGGSIGDSGLTNAYMPFIANDPNFQEHVAASPEAMYATLRNRQVLRTSMNPQTANWILGIGMSMGVNPKFSLPPFFPSGRGEDILFATMLRNCLGGRGGYLNYAMWHTPKRVSDLDADLKDVGNLPLAEFIYLMLCEINPTDLDMFGQTLIALSESDLTWVHRKWRLNLVEKMRSRAANYPEHVAFEMGKMCEALEANSKYAVPSQLIRDYGELLMAWPRIFEVAKNYGKWFQVRLHPPTV